VAEVHVDSAVEAMAAGGVRQHAAQQARTVRAARVGKGVVANPLDAPARMRSDKSRPAIGREMQVLRSLQPNSPAASITLT
jgi:hypothetical protein